VDRREGRGKYIHFEIAADARPRHPKRSSVVRDDVKRVAAKTTRNAKNLEALDPERLAELLLEISAGNAKRRLTLELVGALSRQRPPWRKITASGICGSCGSLTTVTLMRSRQARSASSCTGRSRLS
jgi:hypothetical protein